MERKTLRTDDDIIGDSNHLIDRGPRPSHEVAIMHEFTSLRVREVKEHIDKWGRVVLMIAVLVIVISTFFLLTSLTRVANEQLPMHISAAFIDSDVAKEFQARNSNSIVLFLQTFAIASGLL